MKYKGLFNNASSYPTGTISKDDVYLLQNNSTIGNKNVTANSYLLALVNNPGSIDSNWTIVNNSYIAEDIANKNQPNGYVGLDSNNSLMLKSSNTNNLLINNSSTLTADRQLNVTIPDATTSLTLTGNTSLSGTNTGDETLASISTKVGNASTTTSGLLTSTDWNTFNNKVSTTRTINSKALSSNITLVPADLGAEATANKNVANGYAGLDANTKLALAQMPITGLSYKGTWNASTNTPTLPTGSPLAGDYYKVSVAGSTSVSSINTWRVNDWIIYNGSSWDRIVNSESVTSVNSKTGAVTLTASDIGLGNVNNIAISNLDSLTDVVISGAANNQVLQYNGSNWVNQTLTTTSDLDSLTDVVISSPANNQTVLYNGTNWINSPFPSVARWNEIVVYTGGIYQSTSGGIIGFGNIQSGNYANQVFNIRDLITPNYGGNNSIIGVNTTGYVGRKARLRFVVAYGGTFNTGSNSSSILVNGVTVSTVSTPSKTINSYNVHDLTLDLNNVGGTNPIQATVNFGMIVSIDFFYYGLIID